MEDRKKSRTRAKAAITRIETFIRNSEDDPTIDINEFTVREMHLVKVFEEYTDAQNVLEDEDEIQENDRIDVENRYFLLAAKFKKIIHKLSSQNISDRSSSRQDSSNFTPFSQVNLPKITLPAFNGKYDEWTTFIDLFTALVDQNQQITSAQKFMYLKSHVKNEPLTLINELPLTNENYQVALDLLKKRYDNKLVIINSHIKGLLDTPSVANGSANHLRNFLSQIRQHLNSLRALNLPIDQWDLLLIYVLSRKLDFRTHQAFELERNSTELPKLIDFLTFLEKRCFALENVSTPDSKIKPRVTHFTNSPSSQSTNTKKCIFCKLENHSIYTCSKFKECSDVQRKQFVQSNKLCFNCLGTRHNVAQCTSVGCRICFKKHHTLLHRNTPSYTNETSKDERVNSQVENTLSPNNSSTVLQQINPQLEPNTIQYPTLVTNRERSQIVLATAQVTLITERGAKIQARALLDSASQTTFITLELFKRLNVNGYRKIINIQGISSNMTQTNCMVDVKIESHIDKSFKVNASCAVLNKITCPLPHSPIDTQKLEIPPGVNLADPSFHVPSKIDMLIGADLFFDLIVPGLIRLGPNLPTLQNSYLGWIVAGPIPNQNCCLNVSLFTQADNVNELIPRFWQLEELSTTQFLSPEDKICEQKYLSTVKRTGSGAFQVNLPLREENDYLKLGNSYSSAARRFLSLEKRLSKEKELFAQYKRFIDEYVELGHARYVPLIPTQLAFEHKYFLPHHCVFRESSSTTKIRVVFDASMKSSSGLSLNDIMLKGFPVQPELFDILCRFRTYKYVITTDIEKMYRQVKINPDQHFLQNILWRDNPDASLKCIQLQTVTYGTNSAPFLATRCLVNLAEQEKINYPLASEAILTQCYVDDILAGGNSIDESLQLVNQLTTMLNSAGFHLHKWCSNEISILSSIPADRREVKMNINDDTHSNKVLGLFWNPHSDTFRISIPSLTTHDVLTKRHVLSRISQMFDPLGFVGPIIAVAKMLMQQIWVSKINWDDQLPTELQSKWHDFTNNISSLLTLSIPRYILVTNTICEIQLHGFSDSSMKCYGACLYLRVLYTNHTVSSNLLCSKSRVAPLKTVSLPRLELCGAVLLAKLLHKIYAILPQKIDKTFLWTDSQIVLCWIKSSPSRWTTFVANRVSEVQELTINHTWKHIKSSENPADFISRGLSASQIHACGLWWHGPQMLQDYNCKFDNDKLDLPPETIPEQKKVALHVQITPDPTVFISNFSNFTRLQRSFAYCLRFIKNCKPGSVKRYGPLSVNELKMSLVALVRLVQFRHFHSEITQLKLGKTSLNSSIISLNPFLDENEILRVGGRLNNAEINFDQKHPMLLPSKTHFTRILIQYEHMKLCHAGAQTVLSNIKLRFWPINALREIKHIIKNCVTCHRFKAETSKQIMGSLPRDRVSVARPFLKVGIDFGGPLFIKQSRLRKAVITKCYIALFVCMVTKAVHIELVSSLSTESFLLTLKRFIARRGQPVTIFSDNGTNFRGSSNQLKELHEFFKSKSNLNSIQDFLTARETDWKFIPPNSPHWGGLWEAGIKSTKYHIRRIVGNTHLTFEELSTVLAQIEAILNSRPICPLSNDPSDLTCLTPGHFLIGEPLTSYPERDVSKIPENRLSFWQQCSRIQQHFWNRWSVEYLNRLQNRPKWFKPYPNLKENMVVLIKEDNVSPLQWPLARIVQIMAGPDKKVRVVKVRTQHGIFVRPIKKLCPLPQETC